MKKLGKNIAGIMALGTLVALSSCEYIGHGSGDWDKKQTTMYNITMTNMVNYLNAMVFNTPDGAPEPGPIAMAGGFYSVNFKAVPGAKLSFATMSVVSNDWFFAPGGAGISLFDNGSPVIGDVTEQVHLWDDGVEEEDPATRTSEPGGATAGNPDDDNSVRVVTDDVSSFINVSLDYDAATQYFTLKVMNLRGADADADPIIITPGIVVLHAQDDPLFTQGEPDRGLGLSKIAVQGNPVNLYAWFTETGKDGAPVHLSSSFTVFAPGIVYAFKSAHDPVFTEGEAAMPGSGIEEIAEDGNNGVIFNYITETLSLPAAKSNEIAPVGPGQSLTFTLDVPKGYKLGLNSMFVFSNDWFVSFGDKGYPLAHGQNSKANQRASGLLYLFDAGTEADQPVGLGPDQAPWQSGPNTGADDPDSRIRRVTGINDVQFGKGMIASPEGVTNYVDRRGGYNLIKLTIEAN